MHRFNIRMLVGQPLLLEKKTLSIVTITYHVTITGSMWTNSYTAKYVHIFRANIHLECVKRSPDAVLTFSHRCERFH